MTRFIDFYVQMAEQPENIDAPAVNVETPAEIAVQDPVPAAETSTPSSWSFERSHNCCAYLGDVEKNTEFTGIIEFLKRSRIVHALATPTII